MFGLFNEVSKQRITLGRLGAQGVALGSALHTTVVPLIYLVAQPLNLARVGVSVERDNPHTFFIALKVRRIIGNAELIVIE